jgi:outer membrane protein assembly factor BamB
MTHQKHYRHAWLIAALLLIASAASAQCKYRNAAFKSGEYLSYNLYFNWKFVWVKVGNASMSTVQSHYNGKQAWRTSLITRSSQRADNYFIMRDTLLCYNTLDLEPLYFRKGAREGKRYTVDEVFYSYPQNRVQTRQHRLRHNGEHQWKTNTNTDCVFDMLSIFMRARSFNPEGWKKGQLIHFPITDGIGITPAVLEYKGKTTVKADNGKKYSCLQLSYKELEDGKYKEIVRFFVTDDANHVPVRLDMSLKFGSAKAFLTGAKGLKN